jgi:3',5'-cyclic AMP phosphodiesterase CpdA
MSVRRPVVLFAAALLLGSGCGGAKGRPDAIIDAASSAASDAIDVLNRIDTSKDVPIPMHSDGAPDTSTFESVIDSDRIGVLELLGAPLIFSPTTHGFSISTVLRSGNPSALQARVRAPSVADWKELGFPSTPTTDIAEWVVDGLDPGQHYEYEIRVVNALDGGQDRSLYLGRAVTTRNPGLPFTFAVLTDSHIQPRDPVPTGEIVDLDFYGTAESTLIAVAKDIAASHPDFLIHMGDMLDLHLFGFNEPAPDSAWAKLPYLNYRRLVGDTLGQVAHFPLIGNWEGENGCSAPEATRRSAEQRMLYLPGPKPDTYPQGGSPNQDYYAFTWGDAIFIVLNVMSYTYTCHLLSYEPGLPDDWTLGETQRAWLESTLASATSKWRFLFIHHAVGGAAGDDANSAYGRGGGRAAYVGEQAIIHAMMLKYGVQIFFYGHDHVFTDMVVDGVHYTLPGSAGAPWKFGTVETGYEQYWPDSGHGRVSVSPERVQVDFITLGGELISSYTVE